MTATSLNQLFNQYKNEILKNVFEIQKWETFSINRIPHFISKIEKENLKFEVISKKISRYVKVDFENAITHRTKVFFIAEEFKIDWENIQRKNILDLWKHIQHSDTEANKFLFLIYLFALKRKMFLNVFGHSSFGKTGVGHLLRNLVLEDYYIHIANLRSYAGLRNILYKDLIIIDEFLRLEDTELKQICFCLLNVADFRDIYDADKHLGYDKIDISKTSIITLINQFTQELYKERVISAYQDVDYRFLNLRFEGQFKGFLDLDKITIEDYLGYCKFVKDFLDLDLRDYGKIEYKKGKDIRAFYSLENIFKCFQDLAYLLDWDIFYLDEVFNKFLDKYVIDTIEFNYKWTDKLKGGVNYEQQFNQEY